MPHKVWAVGEEVVAADFNTFLQNQTVPQFPNTPARDTWVAPPTGALAVTTDTGTLWYRTGAGWVQYLGNKPRVRVDRSTTTSIPNETITAVPFSTVRYQAAPAMWAAGSPTRLTVVEAGLYSAGTSIRWAHAAFGYRQVGIRRGGTEQLAISSTNAINDVGSGTPVTDHAVVTEVELAAGDYLETVVFQDSGAALNLSVTQAKPNFWASWQAPPA